jgi:hypothetical protein
MPQRPVPSQVPRLVDEPSAQEAARHSTLEPGYSQLVRDVPSQVPAQLPLPAHEGREPWGAPIVGEHVPALPMLSQASH